jgi:hypothetical protein
MSDRLAALVSTVFASAHGSAYLVAGPFPPDRELPPIYDLRWSLDGMRLTACLGETVTFQRSDADAPIAVAHDNAAGRVRLAGPPEWRGVRAKPAHPWAVAIDHRADGRTLSAWGDGTVRGGLGRTDRVLVTLQNAGRVRASLVSSRFAVRAGRDLYLCDADGEPHVIGRDVEEHAIAWAPARDELAFVTAKERPDHFRDRALVVVDVDGRELRRAPLELGEPPTIAWAADRLIVHRAGGVTVLADDGTTREIARSSPGYPAAIAVTPDGHYAALAVLTSQTTRLEIADLTVGAIEVVPWATRFTSGLPLAFSPAGDALAWIDDTALLQVVRWGEVYEDPDRERLDRADALVREQKLEEALALVRSAALRPSLTMRARAIQGAIEATRAARRKADAARSVKPAEAAPFAVGDQVVHAKLGAGTVRAVDTAKILERLPAELVRAIGLTTSGAHLTTGLVAPAWGQEGGAARLVLWAGAYARRKPPTFDQLLQLLEDPALDGIEQFAMFGLVHQAGRLLQLLETRLARRARFLCLHSVPVDRRTIERLRVPPLVDLEVMWGPTPADAAALAKLAHLRTLRIANGRFGPAGLQTIAATPLFEVLDGHSFADSALADEGAALLATLAPRFRGGVLDLSHAGVTDVGLAELFAAPWARPITTLRLWDTAATDASAHALLASPLAAHLESLVLDRSAIGRDATLALLGLPRLRELQATHTLDAAEVRAGVHYHGPVRRPRRPTPPPVTPRPATPATEVASSWKVGDRVQHAKFGAGALAAVDGDRCDVRFDDGSQRKLVLRVLARG